MYSSLERSAARRLYVISGYTYKAIAHAKRISISQLKEWGKKEGWADARKEIEAAAVAGDSAAVYAAKAREDKVVRLVSSINRRRKRYQLGTELKSILEVAPDELTSMRLGAALTQHELAEILGLNEKTISKLEQGRCRITKAMSIAIRAVLPATKISNAV
jgi:DNA-binding XRE family transcriptional regulator